MSAFICRENFSCFFDGFTHENSATKTFNWIANVFALLDKALAKFDHNCLIEVANANVPVGGGSKNVVMLPAEIYKSYCGLRMTKVNKSNYAWVCYLLSSEKTPGEGECSTLFYEREIS